MHTCINCLNGGIIVSSSGTKYNFLETIDCNQTINYENGDLGCRNKKTRDLLSEDCIKNNFKHFKGYKNIKIHNIFKDFYLNVQLVDDNAKMPTRANTSDAGLDFYTPDEIRIKPYKDALIPIGIKLEFPDNFVLVIQEKSGIATKKKIDVGAKIIDSNYRGMLYIHLFNNSHQTIIFNAGDKVAQGIIYPCWTGTPKKVEYISEDTQRGTKGFGSTG